MGRAIKNETEEEKKARYYGYQKKYAANNKEKRRKWNRDWIAKNKARYNEAKAENRFKHKINIISHYSSGAMACARCGYDSDIDGLCLDHINDDGAQHRKDIGISSRGNEGGTNIYDVIRRDGFIDGLQVLCHNCNSIKARRLQRGRTSDEMLQALADNNGWKS